MRPSTSRLASIAKPTQLPATTTPTSSRLKNRKPPLSLQAFIQRQRVLALYRDILRSLYRHMPNPQRHESIAYVREEFWRNRNVDDVDRVRYLVSVGKAEWDTARRGVEANGLDNGR
jgi:hypothetical protein